jgi:hypothetical protein
MHVINLYDLIAINHLKLMHMSPLVIELSLQRRIQTLLAILLLVLCEHNLLYFDLFLVCLQFLPKWLKTGLGFRV